MTLNSYHSAPGSLSPLWQLSHSFYGRGSANSLSAWWVACLLCIWQLAVRRFLQHFAHKTHGWDFEVSLLYKKHRVIQKSGIISIEPKPCIFWTLEKYLKFCECSCIKYNYFWEPLKFEGIHPEKVQELLGLRRWCEIFGSLCIYKECIDMNVKSALQSENAV